DTGIPGAARRDASARRRPQGEREASRADAADPARPPRRSEDDMHESKSLRALSWVRNVGRGSPWLLIAIALHVIVIGVAALSYVHGQRAEPPEVATNVAVGARRE